MTRISRSRRASIAQQAVGGVALPDAPGWHIDGNIIRDSDDQRITLRGATAWMLPMFGPWSDFVANADKQYQNRDAIFTFMASKNINICRIGLSPASIASDGTPSAIYNRAKDLVASAAAQGIMTMFTFWSADGTTPAGTALTTHRGVLSDFYAVVGDGSGWVIYNPLNEPHDITDSAWQTMSSGFVSLYRSTLGFDGIITLDPNNYAGAFDDSLAAIAAVQAADDNLLWSFHQYANGQPSFTGPTQTYNGTDWFEPQVGAHIADYAIATTESGDQNGDPSTINHVWNTEFMDYTAEELMPRGYNGHMGFIWSWVDNPMTNADSGTGADTLTDLTTLNTFGNINNDHIWSVLEDGVEPAAAFPSRLVASGRNIVDANGAAMEVMKGFNVHGIADFGQDHFDDMYALGARFIRIIVRWDNFEPTSGTISGLSGDTTGRGGTATGAILALDHTIARAEAAGLYSMIDFHLMEGAVPAWAQTTGQGNEQDFLAHGQSLVQKLANRYGNPASANYAVSCTGLGPNEVPVSDATTRNGNGSIPYLENIHRTWIGWMRTYAANWIGYVCYGWASQTPIRVSGYNGSMTEASATAYNAVGGNVVIDLHDYFMGDTRDTSPYDGRQFNGQLYAFSNGGPGYGTGDENLYPPSALRSAQHAAFVAPYKAFSISAGIPIMVGEWGWPILSGSNLNAGEQQWLDDKQVVWDDAGFVIRLQWNYDVTSDYNVNTFTARPDSNWRYSVVDEIGGSETGLVFNDKFATVSEVALTAHTSDSGHTWSEMAGRGGAHVATGGFVYSPASGSGNIRAWNSAVPASTEYEVVADLQFMTATGGAGGILIGMDTAADTEYGLVYDTGDGAWYFFKSIAGVVTVFNSVDDVPGAGEVVRIGLQRFDGGVSAYIYDSILDEADDTAITAVGHGGISMDGTSTTSTGLRISNFQINNVVI